MAGEGSGGGTSKRRRSGTRAGLRGERRGTDRSAWTASTQWQVARNCRAGGAGSGGEAAGRARAPGGDAICRGNQRQGRCQRTARECALGARSTPCTGPCAAHPPRGVGGWRQAAATAGADDSDGRTEPRRASAGPPMAVGLHWPKAPRDSVGGGEHLLSNL